MLPTGSQGPPRCFSGFERAVALRALSATGSDAASLCTPTEPSALSRPGELASDGLLAFRFLCPSLEEAAPYVRARSATNSRMASARSADSEPSGLAPTASAHLDSGMQPSMVLIEFGSRGPGRHCVNVNSTLRPRPVAK